MDQKVKIVTGGFIFLLCATVVSTFIHFFVLKNYIIEFSAPCDHLKEQCFVRACDLEEGEKCIENESYFKIMRRIANNIPLCDPKDVQCGAYTCDDGEKGCEILYCSEATSKEYETECDTSK